MVVKNPCTINRDGPVIFKILVLKILCILSTSETALAKRYSFAVIPQQPAQVLARKWIPLLKHVSEVSGVEITYKTAPSIPVFLERVNAQQYDFAYMNPYFLVVLNAKKKYSAFGRARDKKLHGILVVHKDSKVKSIQDLSGEVLGFPSPLAFAASLVVRAHLRNQGVEFVPRYVASHDSVYVAINRGAFPGGGGIIRTLDQTNESVKKNLKVLWKSPGYTPHAFAYKNDTPENVVKSLSNAFFNLEKTPQGKSLLEGLSIKGIIPASNKEWDAVKVLGIDELMEEK